MDRHLAPPRARPVARRGFTLIEILVALSAGLMVSAAAFALSKSATNFFQRESRVANAQLAVSLGLNRVSADLQRAALFSSPNAAADPMVCRDASWATLPGLSGLAGIRISQGAALPGNQGALNGGMRPDDLWIGGSLGSSEAFTVQCVLGGGGSASLQLQTGEYDNAMARVYASLGPETLAARLATIFPPGRMLMLFDPATGYKIFSAVDSVPTVVGTGIQQVATIALAPNPNLPMKPASFCGIAQPPHCGGGLIVSAVSHVKYSVVQVPATDAVFAPVVAAQAAATAADDLRTELMREEFDAADKALFNTRELIAEFAVDMRFGLTEAVPGPPDTYTPTVRSWAVGDANVYQIAGDSTGSVPNVRPYPQRVRSVQVRLATRTRAPDRDTDLATGIDGRKLHFLVSNSVNPRYARMRTAYANISLANQGGFSQW